jgi:hypothetical protein
MTAVERQPVGWKRALLWLLVLPAAGVAVVFVLSADSNDGLEIVSIAVAGVGTSVALHAAQLGQGIRSVFWAVAAVALTLGYLFAAAIVYLSTCHCTG